MTEQEFMSKFQLEMEDLFEKERACFHRINLSPEGAAKELDALQDILDDRYDNLQQFIIYQSLKKEFEPELTDEKNDPDELHIGDLVKITVWLDSITVKRAINPTKEIRIKGKIYSLGSELEFLGKDGYIYIFKKSTLNPDFPRILIGIRKK